VLLLLSSDIKAILRLGPRALITMFCGSAGIMLGTVAVMFFFRGRLGDQAWAGFGSLSASWTGGSANMIAVKEALSTPESVFTPMVVVDTIVPYVWMGILIALAGRQAAFDHWNHADSVILDDLSGRIKERKERSKADKYRWPLLLILLIGSAGMIASRFLSGIIPEVPQVLSRYDYLCFLYRDRFVFYRTARPGGSGRFTNGLLSSLFCAYYYRSQSQHREFRRCAVSNRLRVYDSSGACIGAFCRSQDYASAAFSSGNGVPGEYRRRGFCTCGQRDI
jgi:hypothetical protein